MEKLSRYKKIGFIGGSLLLIVLIFLIGLSVGQRKQVNKKSREKRGINDKYGKKIFDCVLYKKRSW